MAMAGLAMLGSFGAGLLISIIGVNCFVNCYQMRAMMKAEGPWGFSEEESAIDYSASLRADEPRKRKLSPRLYKKVRRREARERAEQEKIDAILAKVSAHGMHSLTWWEKRTLHRATERQRKRDLEISQRNRF
jgi:hypothetical protein